MPAWTLTKTARFEASHVLPRQDGKCARLHGHSWTVAIEVRDTRLQAEGPQAGMVLDYAAIGRPLHRLIERALDHYHLNDTTGLADPTSEALAEWIYQRLQPEMPYLRAVTIEETCTSRCRYEP